MLIAFMYDWHNEDCGAERCNCRWGWVVLRKVRSPMCPLRTEMEGVEQDEDEMKDEMKDECSRSMHL